ncbi:Dynamin family protein [Synechococcus sp. PCC 7335]|nr:Dynamin family protein [Synechococcus sp. PCC 7335]
MISQMLKGVQRHKIYARPNAISCLMSTLSVSEKLIILGFGSRLAISDGYAAVKERQYLNTVASTIDVPAQQLKALSSCISGKQSEVDQDVVEELRCLLDPQRFQNIDAAIVNAASFLSSRFLTKPKSTVSVASRKPSYAKLKKFQGYQEQLSQIYTDLVQLLQVKGAYDIFPSVLKDEVRSLAQKVQSQKFRLAVVGEFSQGKSTFLNALLGEELQPVRAIPCSGALTVLKYGPVKRVVCYYKDGTQSEIPFDQYQQQASIPEEAALGNRELKLAESNIDEIVLEHPDLELCRHQVEIVDSPGLNEHPDRTAVTERLLQDTDAAIFLANAQRPMTKGERDLLKGLKHRLQIEDSGAPASNLFVLVNFMDLLRSPEDKAQVQTLVKNVVHNPADPLVSEDNRVHFVSARSALEATLTQTPNEHSKPFSEFVSALETFLVEERGELILKKGIVDMQRAISGTRDSLEQMTNLLEGKLSLSKVEQQKMLEQTGKISGFHVKIQELIESLNEEALSEVSDSWDEWLDRLDRCLASRSKQWITILEKEENIYRAYVENFTEDVFEVLDIWIEESVVQTILKPKLDKLDSEFFGKTAVIQQELQSIDDNTGTTLYEQFEISGIRSSLEFQMKLKLDIEQEPDSFWEKVGFIIGGAVAVPLIPIFFVGDLVGLLGDTTEDMKSELKMEVISKGVNKFLGDSKEILEKIFERVEGTFEHKAQDFQKVASASISILCNLIEQQESILQETLAQKETGLALIQQKSLRLQAIETALDNLTKTALEN